MSLFSEIEAGLASAAHKGLHIVEVASHALVDVVHATVPPNEIQGILKTGASALLTVAAPAIATGEALGAEAVGDAVAGAVGPAYGPAIGAAVTSAVSSIEAGVVTKAEGDISNLGT